MYLQRRENGQGPLERQKTERERTPEQTDDTNEHEPEVWRNYGEVNGLRGYVYGPGFTSEGGGISI